MSLSKEIEDEIMLLIKDSNMIGWAIRQNDEIAEKKACDSITKRWIVLNALLRRIEELESGFKYDETR